MTHTTGGARQAAPRARRAGAALLAAAGIALLSGCAVKTAPEAEGSPISQGQEAGQPELDREQVGTPAGAAAEPSELAIIGDCSGARVEELGGLGRPQPIEQGSSAPLAGGASAGLAGVRCEAETLLATLVLGTHEETVTVEVPLGEPVPVPGVPVRIVLVEIAPAGDSGAGARVSLVEIAA